MTELTITPDYGRKRLKFAGTVAAGEHVAVTVAGAAEWASAEGAKLRLRVMFGKALVGIVGGDAEAQNPWQTHSDDPAIAEGAARCELNLNTIPAEKMLKCGGNCFWILDDATNHTLYGAGEWDVRAWPKRRGVDEPMDLDGYPQLVEDIEGLKEAWEEYKATVNAALADKADRATTYTKSETDAAIVAAKNGRFKVVQELPSVAEAESNVIYLVPRTDGETGNVYDEWVVQDGAWEKIGTADVDLTDYYDKSEVDVLLAGKVPTTRKVNNKALSADISLTASDVDALGNSGAQSLAGALTQTASGGVVQTLNSSAEEVGIKAWNGSNYAVKYLANGIYVSTDGGTTYIKLSYPSVAGALALVSQLADFLPLTGGTMTRDAVIDEFHYVNSSDGFGGDCFRFRNYRDQTESTDDVIRRFDLAGLAPLASPAFTGTPTAPTPTSGDDSTKVATTAFVQAAVAGGGVDMNYVLRIDPETGNIYYTTPDTNA